MYKLLLGAWLVVTATSAMSNSYIGIGTFQSEFMGSEFDRKYVSDVNDIRQINFGYNNKGLVEIFGDVNIDGDSQIQDFVLGLALEDTIIRLERGKISGTIIDEDGPVLGSFDNDYQRLDILSSSSMFQGFHTGVGIQRYAVPHLFELNDGSIQGQMLQDDALAFTSVGFGIYYDPIYDLLMSDLSGMHNDWYFAVSTLAISLAYVSNSDSPDLVSKGMNDQNWLMWGNSGTYELWLVVGLSSAGCLYGGQCRLSPSSEYIYCNLNPLEYVCFRSRRR